ncbi:MAG: exopolysaccharide biosynthesis polyprenyl glycosylphosphotransferase [Acetobacteraceae bacterium]|nr:exopolysaccharide biosynthesis polyprenyl glycosylphosphotransferase [Acetobacteraceae bacterium]
MLADGHHAVAPARRRNAAAIRTSALFGGDVCATVLSVVLAFVTWTLVEAPSLEGVYAHALRYGVAWQGWSTLLMFSLLLAYFAAKGQYTSRVPFWTELRAVLSGVLFAAMGDALIRATVFEPMGAESAVRWAWMIPSLLTCRQAVRMLLNQQGLWALRTVMIGQPAAMPDARAALLSEPGLGYEIAGMIDLKSAAAWPETLLWSAIERCGAEFVVLLTGSGDIEMERQLARALEREGMPYGVAPGVEGLPVTGFSSHYFLTHDVVLFVHGCNLALPASRVVKLVFDQVVAALLLAALLPLFVVLAALIRADGGPALFRHERIGFGGRRFKCLKFRTMVTDADVVLRRVLQSDPGARAEWEETQKLRDDPRVTAVGAFLRKTSLDELPQLLNVVRGEMSLVGPRPIVQAEVRRYGQDIAYYYDAKPGLTGLWQVSGRSDTSYEHRVKLDVWYVRNWALWHDITILLKTIPAVLLKKGAV